MIVRFAIGLALLASLSSVCSAQPGAAYTLTVTKTLTPYVDGVNQGPPDGVYDAGDKLESLATFKFENNSLDSMYVLVEGKMIASDGNNTTVAEYNAARTLVEIPSGEHRTWTDVGFEYDTPDPAPTRYVANLSWRISYDPDMDEAGKEVLDLGYGGWNNVFRERRRK